MKSIYARMGTAIVAAMLVTGLGVAGAVVAQSNSSEENSNENGTESNYSVQASSMGEAGDKLAKQIIMPAQHLPGDDEPESPGTTCSCETAGWGDDCSETCGDQESEPGYACCWEDEEGFNEANDCKCGCKESHDACTDWAEEESEEGEYDKKETKNK
ncbi:hypothetical protein BRD56_10295 [Thermoplasmatales archaeon SW_10_69_26]|nr:MAG: hypothetical protein BRD56_10295 [Thermoplasmatales archaeon SW_10_69_26]